MVGVKGILFATLIAGAALPAAGQAARADAAGCTLVKGSYTCDWQAFRTRFEAARTVTLQAEPLDRSTESQLRQLVTSLGKSVAAAGMPADLIFRVAPVNSSGIAIGPADQPLGSLQVYAAGAPGSRGTLLWIETFTAQADRPWPMVVTSLADQFRERFNGRRR